MTNRAYPPSICPGIPRLGKCPCGWTRRTFGQILRVVERPAAIEDDTEYQLVNAKRNRGGIVARERLKGREIKTKDQYIVRAGDFLIANRQIIHGACGIVPLALDGALVSGEYTVLHAKDGLSLQWFTAFTHTPYFQLTCFHSSIGVDVEKMVFKLALWLKHTLHVPPIHEQRKIAEILSAWDEAITQNSSLITEAKRRKKSIAQKILSGKRRLPGASGKWKGMRIGAFANCLAGGTPRTSVREYGGGGSDG
jgi:type I restriction enzyme S subunit